MNWTLIRILAFILSYGGMWFWSWFWFSYFQTPSWMFIPFFITNTAWLFGSAVFSIWAYTKGKME